VYEWHLLLERSPWKVVMEILLVLHLIHQANLNSLKREFVNNQN
jgi:hypothetical protein